MSQNNVNQEPIELMLEKSYHTIVDAFVNSGHLSRREFLAKVFKSAFELIPTDLITDWQRTNALSRRRKYRIRQRRCS